LLRGLSHAETRELAALYASIPAGAGRDVFNAGLGYALVRSWLAYQEATSAPLPREVHPAVQRAAWLLRATTEALDNRELAARCRLSHQRLSRLFKQQMGVPLAEFRNRQRLSHFLHLLDTGAGEKLLASALTAGFGSYAQFYRVFKRMVGSSPAEYLRDRKRLDPSRVLARLSGDPEASHRARISTASPVRSAPL
jgi:AraC-like DNA-binding protein